MPLAAVDADALEGATPISRAHTRAMLLALEALSSRALVWVAALVGGGLWFMAISDPTPLRLIGSLGYCLSVFVPILWRDAKGG